jgi:hypothetical protein
VRRRARESSVAGGSSSTALRYPCLSPHPHRPHQHTQPFRWSPQPSHRQHRENSKGHAVPVDGPGANKPPLHAAIATAGTSHGGQWHAWVKHCEYPRGGGGGKARAPARASRANNFFIILATILLATHMHARAAPHAQSERVELALRCALTEQGAVHPTRRSSCRSHGRVAPPPRVLPARRPAPLSVFFSL